jgi:hypothetical protein
MTDSNFKLTYSTMYNPPEELHTRFEQALAGVIARLGQEHAMIINGKDVLTSAKFEDRSPTNTDIVLGIFQKGGNQEANDAIAAAKKAFPVWSRTPWQKRVDLVRKAAAIMDERTFEMGAVVALEVGKNRMEALGDVLRLPTCSATPATAWSAVMVLSPPWLMTPCKRWGWSAATSAYCALTASGWLSVRSTSRLP